MNIFSTAPCEIKIDNESLKKYSTDASIFEVTPQAVAFPKNKEELQKLVLWSNENNIPLSPRAGGTCMSGGSLTEGVMVDITTGFTHIGEVTKDTRELWVDSGVYYKDLEKTLSHHALMFAPYTSSKDICVLGGMVGNNASGEKSFRYGATIDNVLAVRMICSDGNEYEFGEITKDEVDQKKTLPTLEGSIYRELTTILETYSEHIEIERPKVKKNAAGYGIWNVYNKDTNRYNIAKLIVGSQGTLGFITEVKIKVFPILPHTEMIVVGINDLKDLALVIQLMSKNNPEGVEVYDSHTYDLAKLYKGKEASLVSYVQGNHLNVFGIFSGERKEESNSTSLNCQKDLLSSGYKAVLTEDIEEQEAHLIIRRASFKMLKEHAHYKKRAVPFIEDTIVPLANYDGFLSELEYILKKYDMTYTFAGHIGDGSIRLIPLLDMEKDTATQDILNLAEEVYSLAVQYDGSISVDHNDGIIRTPYLHLMFSEEMLQIFKKIKGVFDPGNLFNPNKKVSGTKEHIIKYISKHN
jgi:FAD/FMN-containing dehydrogenase